MKAEPGISSASSDVIPAGPRLPGAARSRPPAVFSARWALGGLAALAVMVAAVLLIAWALLRPPWQDMFDMAVFLTMSGGLTLLAGLAGAVLGIGRYLRTLRGKLLFLPVLASGLALVNVGFTAKLMFISVHDLGLLAVLLSFSLGMSIFLALFLSNSLSGDMSGLIGAVRRMGAGDLAARADVRGHDELRELADAFGAMAAQLEKKIATQREVEQARRHLVATVSHDLRTPLASMRAIVESINDGVVAEPGTVRQYMHTLQRETEYLSRLIDDLFELSQLDAGILRLQLEPSDLKDLVSDTLQSLSAQAKEKGVRVTGSVGESVPEVAVDTRRLQRVLYNLVQNAVRHTPSDGTVAVTAEDADAEVLITVEDSGEGIAAEEIDHLFETFHRTDRARSRAHGGAGLGLTIARGIVEAHGGRIWAESAPGCGSRFTFTLPKSRVLSPATG